MGFDLRNARGESYRFNVTWWPEVLKLARAYGWEPAGTECPPHRSPEAWRELGRTDPWPKWDGSYGSNEYARVTPPDAEAIAGALERALEALSLAVVPAAPKHDPNEDTHIHARPDESAEQALERMLAGMQRRALAAHTATEFPPAEPTSELLARWADESGRKVLREFVAFCRGGGFVIA